MNVASKKLCEELYEMSGWASTHWFYEYGYEDVPNTDRSLSGYKTKLFHSTNWEPSKDRWPAYDLGYLLRKLSNGEYLRVSLTYDKKDAQWWVNFDPAFDGRHFITGDSPEDCMAKLAIELFNQDILTREAKS